MRVSGTVAHLAIILAALPSMALPARAGQIPWEGSSCRQSADAVGQYEKLELTVALPHTYANPFDPGEIDLTARLIAPSGKAFTLPGFYCQPHTRSRAADAAEVLLPEGEGIFAIRFAWGEIGRYRYEVTATDSSGAHFVGSGAFQVIAADRPGYIRPFASSPYYFQRDSGGSYFPIGENMCWPAKGGSYDYDLWMSKLAASGGNYLRLWLVNEWNKLGLERLSYAPDDDRGLGRYDQQAAWRIDRIIALAAESDMGVLMCIESFNSLSTRIYPQWKVSPYNAANGGPCATPADFFTNREARRLFRQRLRYLVARWGYASSVLAWELWNEVDLVDDYSSETVAGWHQEMARYLRSIDPWTHPVTTSYGRTEGDPQVDGIPEMDFVQSHSYGARDMAQTIASWGLSKRRQYRKPHYFGEFGADVYGKEEWTNPTGIYLHNGLWAGMLSGAAGTPMTWWWDSFIDPADIYHVFAPVAAYAEDVDWVGEDLQPVEAAVRRPAGQTPTTYADLAIAPHPGSWESSDPRNRPHEFRITGAGHIENSHLLGDVQHGLVNHPDKHNPAAFGVDYPVVGTFEVIVRGVSGHGGASLRVTLDGALRLLADFPDPLPDDTETMHQYDRAYVLGVPAGPHSIVVENRGADWFHCSYRLTSYLTAPNLRALALANDRLALLWVQNKGNIWSDRAAGTDPLPVDPAEIEIGGFQPGDYDLEQWDTYAGRPVGVTSLATQDGALTITTPAGLTTDVAYKLTRRRGPAP